MFPCVLPEVDQQSCLLFVAKSVSLTADVRLVLTFYLDFSLKAQNAVPAALLISD